MGVAEVNSTIKEQLEAALKAQRQAYRNHPNPSYQERVDDLKSLRRFLIDNKDDIADAISQDYGNRSKHESYFAEIITVVTSIDDTLKHLKSWMRPQKRHVDHTMFFGAKNKVIPQPLGVVGIIVPWNFPINLSFGPLISAFAAGNRCMVKMSENSIQLTRLLQRLSPNYFPAEKLCFFEETGGVGIEFSTLPYDLLFFTGSGQTGRAVMASAARNLTPVILELGGKAPAVIDRDFPLDVAVQRIMFVKQFNAGQICTNVDYVFVHEDQKQAFIDSAKDWTKKHVPDIHDGDYTSIIDDCSCQRLADTVKDAEEKGATIVNLNGDASIDFESRKFPLMIVADTSEDMIIRQRETFGPLLMLLTYRDKQEVLDYINDRDRPLALYPFSNDKALVNYYIDNIMSGGVTVNDALLHVGQHDLPFGGVGPSGMGHYHGKEGFISLSKLRPVFYQAKHSSTKMLYPPYKGLTDTIFNTLMKIKL